MAETAGVARERIVLVSLHETGRARTMGIVALSTVDLRSTQPEMLGTECGYFAIVAGEAQLRNPLGQQALDDAVVRLVTGEAFAVR